jgi:hypothetical protein
MEIYNDVTDASVFSRDIFKESFYNSAVVFPVDAFFKTVSAAGKALPP